MNADIYRARMEVFSTLDLPVSKAGVRRFHRRQRIKLLVWEASLGSLFAVKRLIDITASLAGLVLLSPVFLFLAAAIMIEDGRPVFFFQRRVGLNGRVFRFYKFRSMVRNADAIKAQLLAQNESGDGVIFKMKKRPAYYPDRRVPAALQPG